MNNFKKYQKFDFKKTEFTGYDKLIDQGLILKLFDSQANEVDNLKGHGFIIFDKTPLYAMSGGQASDHGNLFFNESEITLLDVRKDFIDDYFIHEVNTNEIELKLNNIVKIVVDKKYRDAASKNHSALHITWQTIINSIGKYVDELGSKLDNQKYQLQFVYDDSINEELVLKATNLINNQVIPNAIPCKIFYVTKKEAEEKKYLFEFTKIKDGEMVRMVEFKNVVIEPCSGTHVNNTKDLTKIWFMNYEKESKRIVIEMTSNFDIAKQFFEEKLLNKINELENIIAKGKNSGINTDLNQYLIKANSFKNEWNYLSIKEVNNIFLEVTAIVNKFLKEKEKEIIEEFNNLKSEPKTINDKYNLFMFSNEFYLNKVLMQKALKSVVEFPNLVNIFVNQFENKTNIVIIRNKELNIELKKLNQEILNSTNFKGGGTDSMVQLVSDDLSDFKKLINLLK